MSSSERKAAIQTAGKVVKRFGAALLAFLRGFVGETALPRDRHAARHELTHRANGRGRCC